MRAEFQKIFKLFEELEEAGESATLTISSKGGISSIRLLLESSPSSPSTGTTTLPPATGRRRRHRGAAARARRRQRAADHQASKLAAPLSAFPPAPGEASVPSGSQHDRPLLILPSPSPTSGRRRVMSLGRPPPTSFGSLNLDGRPLSSPPPLSSCTASKRTGALSIAEVQSTNIVPEIWKYSTLSIAETMSTSYVPDD